MRTMDRHIVIAGGGSGIGAALCSSCIRQGANVLVCDKLDAVNFLISDEAKFITGAVLPVDGGKSLAGL